ncbi:uncharacterized protein L3040_001625 [Drepanopeziza brunnea f. sp. 'multigermtubi']|uniref:uncharacterized protein n=1 Tax=Drepanopeziza brunnea f. sp. 'multigermtubi' TaxID=698441 RepID=UPI002399412C|nr:hypothetical protein L3040_001625 [Drepanopeziza brunnea f. sp. 'multigermtubi']
MHEDLEQVGGGTYSGCNSVLHAASGFYIVAATFTCIGTLLGFATVTVLALGWTAVAPLALFTASMTSSIRIGARLLWGNVKKVRMVRCTTAKLRVAQRVSIETSRKRVMDLKIERLSCGRKGPQLVRYSMRI